MYVYLVLRVTDPQPSHYLGANIYPTCLQKTSFKEP